MVNNGPGNDVREKSNIKAIADKIVSESTMAVDIGNLGNLHKSIKTDADGNN